MKKQSENKPPIIAKNKKKPAKIREESAGYRNGYLWGSWRQYAPTQEFLRALAEELKNRIKNDDRALTVERFLIEKEIPATTFHDWKLKSEDLRMAFDFARMVIADRRESGAIEKRYDATAALFRMSEYSDAWKAIVEWKSKLRESITNAQGISVVEIPAIESSPMVPPKKID